MSKFKYPKGETVWIYNSVFIFTYHISGPYHIEGFREFKNSQWYDLKNGNYETKGRISDVYNREDLQAKLEELLKQEVKPGGV